MPVRMTAPRRRTYPAPSTRRKRPAPPPRRTPEAGTGDRAAAGGAVLDREPVVPPPTPEEIVARAAEVRAGWSAETELERRAGGTLRWAFASGAKCDGPAV